METKTGSTKHSSRRLADFDDTIKQSAKRARKKIEIKQFLDEFFSATDF